VIAVALLNLLMGILVTLYRLDGHEFLLKDHFDSTF